MVWASQLKGRDYQIGWNSKAQLYAASKKHLEIKDTHSLKVKEWKKICDDNTNQRKGRVTTLETDKVDLRA